jgi:hypothetical protein
VVYAARAALRAAAHRHGGTVNDAVLTAVAGVKAIIPVAVGDAGNTTVAFTVLSYADAVAITAVTDFDRVPDLSTLTEALRAELDSIVGALCSS